MAEKVGSIYYDLDLDDKKFNQGVDKATKKLSGLEGAFKDAEQGSMALLGGLTLAGAGALAFGAASLKTAADLETMEAGFVTLLGSADKARKTMDRIKKEAARTPFEIPGLTSAVQMLAAVTKDGDKATDIVLNVGEALAAMGKGQPELDRIAGNLQQIGAVGRAGLMDIRQFAFAGIPIFEMLQEETGLAGEKLEDFISDGKVSFDLLTKLFRKATDEGGRFAGAFENQGGTLNQLLSNLSDNVNILGADFIKNSGILDIAKDAVGRLNEFFTDLNKQIKDAGGFTEFLSKKFEENKEAVYVIAGAITVALVPAFVALAASIWAAMAPLIPFLLAGAAIGLLLFKLQEHFGGLDNMLKKLQETFQPLIDTFNNEIRPRLEELGKIVAEYLQPALDELGKVFREELWPALQQAWTVIQTELLPALQELWALVAPVLLPALKTLAMIIGGILLIALKTFIGSMSLAISIFSKVVGAITWVISFISHLIHEFSRIAPEIQRALNTVGEAIMAPFRKAFQWLDEKTKGVRENLDRLNPFHRESPSIVDWVRKGTGEVVDLYDNMFSRVGDMSAGSRLALLGSAESLNSSAEQMGNAPLAQGVTNITINPQGIIASSRSAFREIIKDGLDAVNEELRATGRPEISVPQSGGSSTTT